eukprot:CAMPEP_0205819352 /NCGR_PEP_ID=MMETSP0206-20130828/1689_1 /ASSEMBLY_ACC=CAM_ASM_000279 /TAXON_ID=36767 /ORGANISM="Euplotes focardii, Strain TN1" /LENGTH=470 /DNA_ID=CAMNT_0053112845 /DNA_START=20 /DNA_END=1432 /DNA_ORIENTATION=-
MSLQRAGESKEPDYSRFPGDVGILAMDIYFPSQYVDQGDMEDHDGASKGKYTIGLGQHGLAYCTDVEDIYSISLTALSNLMEKYDIDYKDIGRLEVASETIIDHSKSIKTVLMQLFADSGNSDVEGIDSMNACYAGTNALFNSIAWVESSAWDGRLALVVAADIAEYAKGPARPTGGCGAVAMLIGPGAPLVIERGCRSSHMEHVYDFYKPNLESPYPVVDGKYSNVCYLRSVDLCLKRYRARYQRVNKEDFSVTDTDYVVFHSPYNKLVQKSYARLLYNDFMEHPERPEYSDLPQEEYRAVTPEESYAHRPMEKAFCAIGKATFAQKVGPTCLLPQELGNMYTASMYASLLSLVHSKGGDLAGKHVLLFSYGSGLAASLFSIRGGSSPEAVSALERIQKACDLDGRLAARTKLSPEHYNQTVDLRAELHKAGAFAPEASTESLFPGTFYLKNKDAKGRRFYDRSPRAKI